MFNKQIQEKRCVTFHNFSRKGYALFSCLHKEVRIGVLAAATLATASQALAVGHQPSTLEQTEQNEDDVECLSEVTVSGSLAPLTQLQSARIVSVLSREDVQRAGAQSVNDLLKIVSGVDVRQRGGFGIQTDISIDGGTFDQIIILLNGVNISNPHTGHLAADFPVTLDDIERIEVLEGASSRAYGAAAFGGAINIVTRKEVKPEEGLTKAIDATFMAEGGSWGTLNAAGRIATQWGRLRQSLSGSGGRSDGGTTNSDWRRGQLYYNGDYRSDALSLDWQFGFSRKQYGANTFYSAAYPNQFERNERYLISISAETKGRFHFTPNVYWNRTYDDFQLIRSTQTGQNFHQADVYGVKLGGHIQWALGRTALAAELRQEGILSTSLGKDLDAVQYDKAHFAEHGELYKRGDDRTNISFNLEHNILLDHWTISAGVLAYACTTVDHRFRFYPGVDIAYRPNGHWKVFLSYNKGFRLPSFTELYYKSVTHEGNKGLRPEESHSVQLGTTYRQPGIMATMCGFYHHGHNMIDWVMLNPDDIMHSASFELDNMGAKADLHLNFAELMGHSTWVESVQLGYTFLHQIRHDDLPIYKSNYALEYLRHKCTALLSHRILSALSATWNFRWQERMGNYIRYEGTQSTGELQNYTPYATLDLKLQWKQPVYELYVQGSNLTNKQYFDLGNIPQPGICILGGVKFKL